MPSSADFLSNATKGLNYVKSRMVLGADNKISDRLLSLNASRHAVLSARELEKDLLQAQGIPMLAPGATDWPRHGFQYIEAFDTAVTKVY